MNGLSTYADHRVFKFSVLHYGVSELAERLKALRQSASPPISLRELADAVGISHAGYHRYEARDGYKQRWLPMDFTRRIARVLADRGVNPDDVLALAGVETSESASIGLSAGQQMLVDLYTQITADQRRAILTLMRTMVPSAMPDGGDRP